jgi:hypothetical protein
MVRIPEGKRPLRRGMRRWDDNIKMYFKEKGWEDVSWFHLALWRVLVNG